MHAKLNKKNLKYIKSYDEMVMNGRSIHKQPLERTIEDLPNPVNPNGPVNFCNKAGADKLLRISPWGIGAYPVPVAENLATSEDKMADIRKKVHQQLQSLLLYTTRIVLATHQPLTYHVYSILLTNRNSNVERNKKHYNQLQFQDPINHQSSYHLMKQLLSLLKKQLYHKKLAGCHLITADIENPYSILYKRSHKFSKMVGNTHRHALLISPRPLNLAKVSTLLNDDFYKIFGYQSIFHLKAINARIQPLMNYDTKQPVTLAFKPQLQKTKSQAAKFSSNLTASRKMINYILTDYHLQTKDCSHGCSGNKFYPVQNKKDLHRILTGYDPKKEKYADVPFMDAPLLYRSMLVSAQLNSSKCYTPTKMSRAYLNRTKARAKSAEDLELNRIHVLDDATKPTVTTVSHMFSITSPALLENVLEGNFRAFKQVYSATIADDSLTKVSVVVKYTQLSSSDVDSGGLDTNQAVIITAEPAELLELWRLYPT